MVLIKLKIKTLDGVDSTITVDDEGLLTHLRSIIQQACRIPAEQQRLIFRGRLLADESLSLKDQGISDGLALHVVTKPPPSMSGAQPVTSQSTQQQQSSSNDDDETGISTAHAQLVTQNLIVGNVPFERTQLFSDPTITMNMVTNVLEEIRRTLRLETETTMHLDRPNDGDFAINVIFRGNRNQIVNSPSRERFETLKIEVKKLAWLVALMESQFLAKIDAIFARQPEPPQESAYRAIGNILLAMHAFDHFDEPALRQFTELDRDVELLTLVQELDTWQLPDDEMHVQVLNASINVRHCLSTDLSRLLIILNMVEAKITEHLLSRYNSLLARSHNLQPSSYSARLLNCFASAVVRVQHARAHIYHSFSDIGVHVDDNGLNRLYPQFATYETEEPPQADITLMFCSPQASDTRSTNQSNRAESEQMDTSSSEQRRSDINASSTTEPTQNENTPSNTAFNSVLSGLMSFAHQLMGASGPSAMPTTTSRLSSSPAHPSSRGSASSRYGSSLNSRSHGSTFESASSNISGLSSPSAPGSTTSGSYTSAISESSVPSGPNSSAIYHSSSGISSSPRPTQTPSSVAIGGMLRPSQVPLVQPNRPATPLFGRIPRPVISPPQHQHVRNLSQPRQQQPRVSPLLGGLNIGWSQTSPEAPNAMFVGPRPPVILPLFTMDPFLACPSRRYRVFESDSRHDDFWNDPITIQLGIRPPPNSIAASIQLNDQQPQNVPFNMPSAENVLNGMQGRSSSQPSDGTGQAQQDDDNNEDNSLVRTNANGEAIFNNAEEFGRFLRRVLESIARCMAQYDASIVPQNATRLRNGFTADSRVSGFAPYLIQSNRLAAHMQHSARGIGMFPNFTGMPADGNGHIERLITITAEIRPETHQPPGDNENGNS